MASERNWGRREAILKNSYLFTLFFLSCQVIQRFPWQIWWSWCTDKPLYFYIQSIIKSIWYSTILDIQSAIKGIHYSIVYISMLSCWMVLLHFFVEKFLMLHPIWLQESLYYFYSNFLSYLRLCLYWLKYFVLWMWSVILRANLKLFLLLQINSNAEKDDSRTFSFIPCFVLNISYWQVVTVELFLACIMF